MNIIHIDNEEYYIKQFHERIDSSDEQTIGFSNHSIGFYRSFYKYEEKPVKAIEVNGEIVSVLFYSIPKRDNYVTILNIVTPIKHRQKGYAKVLMQDAVTEAYEKGKRRLRMNCDNIPGTIAFYNKLGCIYWGMTKQDALYCNIPLISNKLEDFHKLNSMEIKDLLDQSSINLAKRRMDFEASADIYKSTPQWVDLNKYKHNEFLTYTSQGE